MEYKIGINDNITNIVHLWRPGFVIYKNIFHNIRN